MTYIDTDPVAEVRRNREALLKQYGGIDGLHKHMDEERPELEKRGWKFMPIEEILAKKHARVTAGKQVD
jgi:hypothetical protein